MTEFPRRIVYAGIYPPTAPRDKVYLCELARRGANVVECVDKSPGFAKYRALYRCLRRAARTADLIWVGYLSPVAVLVAYFASDKPIVYNALSSAYEAYVLDRAVCKKYSLRALFFWLSDFLSFHFSRVVLVESEAQKRFISRAFLVRKRKLSVVFSGVDEDVFHPDKTVKKSKTFTVAFRGMFIPATGAEYVIEAADLLRNEPVRFVVIGWGQCQHDIEERIRRKRLSNIELITHFLEPETLLRTMLPSHVLLGQFSAHSRLDRTIQHKTSEALALGMPFITRDSVSNRELLHDGENCWFVPPDDARALADKIRYAKAHPDIARVLSDGALRTYRERLAPDVLGDAVLAVLASLTG